MVRLVSLLLVGAFGCAPAFQPSVILDDPRGDDYGPGDYRYPRDSVHAPGSYDLTRVALGLEGEDVVIQVQLRASFEVSAGQDASRNTANRALPIAARGASIEGLALQNIEIYLDTDANPATGERRALPGRGVSLAAGWERAVWICPRPARARAELARRDAALAERVIVPDLVVVRGRTLTARIPKAVLGEPDPSWGYAVLLTGAFSDDAYAGKDGPLLARAVLPNPDADAFQGKGPPVIDLWVPPGASPTQEELLRQSSQRPLAVRRGDGSLPPVIAARPVIAPPATAPVVLPASAPASAPASQPSAGEVLAAVLDQQGDIVTLQTAPGALRPGSLGTVPGEAAPAVVVTEVFGEVALARVLSAGRSLAGVQLRFRTAPLP